MRGTVAKRLRREARDRAGVPVTAKRLYRRLKHEHARKARGR